MLLSFAGNFTSNQLPPSVHLVKGSLDFSNTIKVRTILTLVYFLCIISNICSVTGSQRTTCMSATYAARSEPSLKDPWVTRTLRLLYLAASGDWEKYMLLQSWSFIVRLFFMSVCGYCFVQQSNNMSTKCLFMFCYNKEWVGQIFGNNGHL